jgi:rhodanese-related sulfurtransferase
MGFRSRIKGGLKKLMGREDGAASPSPRPAPPPAPSVQPPDAVSLANIECGAQELKERLDTGETVVIVDVRTDGEVAGGVIPGAIHIPLQALDARWKELEKADEIVCYCAAGMRSLRAAELLRSKGLINATSLEGGVGAWTAISGELTPLG